MVPNLDIDEAKRAEDALSGSEEDLRDAGCPYQLFGTIQDITDRKRDEDTLQKTQFYLAEGERIAHIGSWAFNSTGFSYWSSELFRIHGLDPSRKPPTADEYLRLIHSDDRELVEPAIRKMLADHSGFDFTKRIVRTDGNIRYVRWVGRPVSHAGIFVGFLGSAMDVTEQEELTRELRRSKAHLVNAQRLSRTGTVGMDVSSNRFFWSDESARIYGYPPGTEPTPDLLLQRVHPFDLNLVTDVHRRAFEGERDFDFEHRLLMPDGSIKYVHNIAHSIRDFAGNEEVLGAITDITEHRLAEAAIRTSEAYLAEAQRLSHTGSFGCKTASGEMLWSEETFRIFGYDQTTTPAVEAILQRVHPDDKAWVEAHIARATSKGNDCDLEYRLLLPDESIKHVHVMAHAAKDESGGFEFVGAVTDITERKRAEEELRVSEHKYRNLVDTTPAFVHTNLPNGNLEFVNRGWLEYLGVPMTDLFGLGWASVIHPEDVEEKVRRWRAAVESGESLVAESRVRRADGEYRWFLHREEPLRNEAGEIVKWYGSAIDIQERKLAEEKIRAQEAELRQILELAPQHIGVYASDGNPLYANRTALEYFGISMDEWIAECTRMALIHPDDREHVRSEKKKLLRGGEALEFEAQLLRHDGKFRWFLFRLSPIKDERGLLTQWYSAATDIEDRKRAEEEIRKENIALREEITKTSMFEEIVGNSAGLRRVLDRVAKVASTDSTVLITGETGTGKELIARAVHSASQRASRPFVSVNFAAIPQSLIPSELFGHEKGAFTGAMARRLGRFELAEGGTIFLDEVGELPYETQVALLRVLQECEFERLGGNRSIKANVRVIVATNRDLHAAIVAGTFREDLFYRLNVFPLEIPPLRERTEDIPMLVQYFIGRYARELGKNIRSISKETLGSFQSYAWPGNIRELRNVIERSIIVCDTESFSVDESWLSHQPLPAQPTGQRELRHRLAHHEREAIEAALTEARGRVFGSAGAAALLGIARSTLESKIRTLKIDKNRFKIQTDR